MSVKLPGVRQSTANISAIWLLQACTLLFSLFSVPLVTRRYGMEGLGIWLLVQQVSVHIQLLELGIASSLGRFLSRDMAMSDAEAYTEHSSSAIAVLVVIGVIIVLLAIPLGMVFPRIFDLPPKLVSDAVVMMVIATVATGLLLPLRSALGVLSSQHRFVMIYGADGLALLLRVVLVVFACTQVKDHGLVVLTLAVFSSSLVGALVTVYASIRSCSYVLFKFRAIAIKPVKEILSVSIASMVGTLAQVLLRQGSPMLVGYAMGIESTPLIALPILLVTSLGPFLSVGSQLIAPIASQLDASGRVDKLKAIYLIQARYMLTGGLFLFAGMALVVPYLLPLWVGGKVLDPQQAYYVYVNLIFIYGGYCLAIPTFLARSILISVGKHAAAARGEILSALSGLAIGWVLMCDFKFGSVGMAWGIALAFLFRTAGVLVRELALYFDMSLKRLFIEVWGLPLLIFLALALALILQIFGKKDFITAALLCLPALGIWGWLVYRLILSDPHRDKLRRELRKLTINN